MFLKGGGVASFFKPLTGYVKDVSPSLTILTTNVPLDQAVKKERSPLGRPAGLEESPAGLIQREILAAVSRCPPLQESVRNLDKVVYGGLSAASEFGADTRKLQ